MKSYYWVHKICDEWIVRCITCSFLSSCILEWRAPFAIPEDRRRPRGNRLPSALFQVVTQNWDRLIWYYYFLSKFRFHSPSGTVILRGKGRERETAAQDTADDEADVSWGRQHLSSWHVYRGLIYDFVTETERTFMFLCFRDRTIYFGGRVAAIKF